MTIWQKWKLPGMKPNKLRKIAVDGESSSPDIPKTPGGTKSTSMCWTWGVELCRHDDVIYSPMPMSSSRRRANKAAAHKSRFITSVGSIGGSRRHVSDAQLTSSRCPRVDHSRMDEAMILNHWKCHLFHLAETMMASQCNLSTQTNNYLPALFRQIST